MLLRTYQLWLHDLYPRAKFNDGLAIIEKLGHTKSLQRLRCGWINETKPNADGMNDSGEDNISETSRPDRRAADPGARQDNISPDANLDAGAKDDQDKTRSNAQTTGVDVSNEDPGFPGDDELDALLAEEPPQISMVQDRTSSNPAGLPPAPSTRAENFDDDFAHDEEIMRELAMWDD
jgi:replication fork protection complex subunit Csm3/Swi3